MCDINRGTEDFTDAFGKVILGEPISSGGKKRAAQDEAGRIKAETEANLLKQKQDITKGINESILFGARRSRQQRGLIATDQGYGGSVLASGSK